MKKMFIGLLFIFLDFYIKLNASKIGLLPNFVGYTLLFMGMAEHLSESKHFETARTFCIPMIIYTAFGWVCDLVNVYAVLPALMMGVLNLLATVCMLYILYQLAMAMRDIETKNEYPLGAEKMKKAWFVMAAAQLLKAVLSLFFRWQKILLPGIALMLTAFAAAIVYIVFFYKAQKEYFVMKAKKAAEAECAMTEEIEF